MQNKYRLRASAFEREREEDKIDVEKVFFLSVEGNATEKEYFEGISSNRECLGINSKVDVEVLKRGSKDTNSAPKQVIELLEEYVRLRETGRESLIEDIPKEFVDKHEIEFIQTFLEYPDSIPRKQRNAFVTDLMKIGYDINYRKYLHRYDDKSAEFGILIDRDVDTHSEINMQECIEYCKKKKYACYIVNPCFEFWLLLHLSDVKQEYQEKMDKIKKNEKVSGNHTFVSNEVSKKAHHGKSGINFKKNYLPFVDTAVCRAKEFVNDENRLIDEIGCNIWKLIEKMKEF